MLRKARLIAPFVRSLVLGAALFTASTSLVGCEDEKDPMTHVKNLKDPVKQRDAIKRLLQMYADAESEDKKDPAKPHVKAILDKIMGPLAETCLDDKVKEQDRSKLVKFMADTRDERALPCMKKTLDDYKPDSNEDDVTNVLLAISAMKFTKMSPEVMRVFKTMEYAREKAKLMGGHLVKALRAVADISQEEEFLKLIEPPIDGSDQVAAVNQGFWQRTSAFMLGEIKSEKAAKPLLKMILSPAKRPLAQVAIVSLVKIGKPAIAPAEALLNGTDNELLAYSEAENLKVTEKDQNGKISEANQKLAKRAYIPIAAEILGNLGSEASAAPMLTAIEKAGDDIATKVIIALALTMLPAQQSTIDAYKKVYEETKLDLEIPAGAAKELLANRASDFLDTSLTPWLVKTATDLDVKKEKQEEVDPVRLVSYVSAVKLMSFEQIAEVEGLGKLETITEREVSRGGCPKDKLEECLMSGDTETANNTKLEWEKKAEEAKKKKEPPPPAYKEGPDDKLAIKRKGPIGATYDKQFKQAKELLTKCNKSDKAESVKCFLTTATDEKNQDKENEFIAIKALYMVGILGAEADRDELVNAVPKLKTDSTRAVALKIIEAMTKKDGNAAAAKLEKFYEDAEEAKDPEKIQSFQIFLQTAARLRARSNK